MANDSDTADRLEALEGEIQAIREQLNGHSTRLNDSATISENLARLSTDLLVLIQAGNRQADRDRAVIRELQSEVRGQQTNIERILDYLFNQQRNGGNGDRDGEQI